MFRAVTVVGLLLAGPAGADRLQELLFDAAASAEFAEQLNRSVLLIEATAQTPDWADPRMAPRVGGMAVVVSDPLGFTRVVTAGPFVEHSRDLRVRLPDGRQVAAVAHHLLGDGALGELVLPPEALTGLSPLPIDPRETLKEAVPGFTIHPGAGQPGLVRGSVVEVMEEPLTHLAVTDLALPHGVPLVTAEGTLLALNFRRHPSDERRSLALTPETLRAWLRPEGPPHDLRPSAD